VFLANTSTSVQNDRLQCLTLPCPSYVAPLMLTQTLASPSGQLRADLLEVLTHFFLRLVLGKMAFFDETRPLVMSPMQRFH
jgi:hypothetical protein